MGHNSGLILKIIGLTNGPRLMKAHEASSDLTLQTKAPPFVPVSHHCRSQLRRPPRDTTMAARRSTRATPLRLLSFISLLLLVSSLAPLAAAYRPGDIVPMLRSGQYHGSRSVWFDVVGRHCPAFAVNREVLMPIPKPTGFTGADPYKITFQIGHEKFHVPWLYVINRKSSEIPLVDFHLKYSGSDLLGVTAKVVDMPHHYVEVHPDIKKNFWDQQTWPKYVLVRYTWEEQAEIDVSGGFYVLFGSGLVLSFILAIYVLQSSQEKLTRFVREAVADSSLPEGGIAKVE